MTFEPPVHPLTGEPYVYRPQRRQVECMHLTDEPIMQRLYRVKHKRSTRPGQRLTLTKDQIKSFVETNKMRIREMSEKYKAAQEQSEIQPPQVLEQIPLIECPEQQSIDQHNPGLLNQLNAELNELMPEPSDQLLINDDQHESSQDQQEQSHDQISCENSDLLQDLAEQKAKIDEKLENANVYVDKVETQRPISQQLHQPQQVGYLASPVFDDPLQKLINTNSAMKLKNEMASYMPEIIYYIDVDEFKDQSQQIIENVKNRHLEDRHNAPFLQPFSYRGKI